MLKITFEYRDELSNWEWRKQTYIMSSVQKCVEIITSWVNNVDCDYRIISVEEV